MPDDLMQYQKKLDQALRGVVRAALIEAATDGLPGDHHFYITFRTKAPGVNISNALHAQYEDEMTIVLQHQFWDLILEDDRFMVTLSFNDIQERLIVPYLAIKAFADPSVNFGLQLKFDGESDLTSPITLDESEPDNSPTVEEAVEMPPEAAEEDGANVVTLDAFRKK